MNRTGELESARRVGEGDAQEMCGVAPGLARELGFVKLNRGIGHSRLDHGHLSRCSRCKKSVGSPEGHCSAQKNHACQSKAARHKELPGQYYIGQASGHRHLEHVATALLANSRVLCSRATLLGMLEVHGGSRQETYEVRRIPYRGWSSAETITSVPRKQMYYKVPMFKSWIALRRSIPYK